MQESARHHKDQVPSNKLHSMKQSHRCTAQCTAISREPFHMHETQDTAMKTYSIVMAALVFALMLQQGRAGGVGVICIWLES